MTPAQAKAELDLMDTGNYPADLVSSLWSKAFPDELAGARANTALFERAVKRCPSMLEREPFASVATSFDQDVMAKASGYVSGNAELVEAERQRIGCRPDGDPYNHTESTAEQDQAVQDVQKGAHRLKEIQAAKDALLGVPIGQTPEPSDEGASGGSAEGPKPVLFDPAGEPNGTVHREGQKSWQEVNAEWMLMMELEGTLLAKFPALAFFRGETTADTNIHEDVMQGDVNAARAEISVALNTLVTRMQTAQGAISGGSLTFLDFPPIHSQLFGQGGGASGVDWKNAANAAIAKRKVADATIDNLLAEIGVTVLAAAAFAFVSAATGGVGGLLIGALGNAAVGSAQALASYDKYQALSAVRGGTLDPRAAIVSNEQVDSAKWDAIINGVLAFVDLAQAGGAAVKAVKGAGAASDLAKAASAGMKAGSGSLKTLGRDAASAAQVAKGLEELGPEGLKAATGKSFKELAEIAGTGSPAGKRLAELAGAKSAAMSATLKADLVELKVGALDPARKAEVLEESLNQLGYVGTLKELGGWKSIGSLGLGGTPASKRLEAWRAGLVAEMEAWSKSASEGATTIKRTGTPKDTSDVDVQALGGKAAAMQEQAEAWLGGRVGVDVEQAKKLLDWEVMIDPTRAHLQDIVKGLDDATRAQITKEISAFERHAVLNARAAEARTMAAKIRAKHPDKAALADQILKDADEAATAAGVKLDPAYQLLSEGELKQMGKDVDALMAQLETATTAEKPGIIRDIGRKQALINASHEHGYVGGGVRRWVTERPEDVAVFASVGIKPVTKFGTEQAIIAALSEGKWINRALVNINCGNPDKVFDGIRNLGKHGDRIATVLKQAGATGQQLADRGEWFAALKAFCDGKVITVHQKELLDMAVPAVQRELKALKAEMDAAIKSLEADARLMQISAEEFKKIDDWHRAAAAMGVQADAASATVGSWYQHVTATVRVVKDASELRSEPEESDAANATPAAPATTVSTP